MAIPKNTAKGGALFPKEAKLDGAAANTRIDAPTIKARDQIVSARGYNFDAANPSDRVVLLTENAQPGNGSIMFDVDTTDYVIVVTFA